MYQISDDVPDLPLTRTVSPSVERIVTPYQSAGRSHITQLDDDGDYDS